MRHLPLIRGAAALGCAVAVAACTTTESRDVLGPTVPTGGAIFKSYVSLGNSLTAGYQSGGINDSTQRVAYPVLLAQAMGTSFVYPSLTKPGCPPPIANFQTGARVGPAVPNNCALRNPALVSYRVNNVAVPGATSFDPNSPSTSSSNALTTLILGGETQVQRALQAKPTFATLWIGDNDLLVPALVGILAPSPFSPGVTPTNTFVSNYAATVNALVAGAPNLKGVLIGVVNASGAPTFTRGAVIFASPQLQAAISAAAGTAVTVLPDCQGSTSLVDLLQMIPQIRAYVASSGATGYPPYIACAKGDFPPSALVGDLFVLDPTEQTQLNGIVAAYNGYIKAKADSVGFAYYDPNVLLGGWVQSGAIPPAPNFGSPTAPFGQYISLDGIHPTAAAQKALANDLINLINTKYGTALKPLQ